MKKRLLLALLIALPALANAADSISVVEPKGAAATIEATTPQIPTAPLQTAATAAALPAAKLGYVDIVRIGGDSERGKALKSLLTTRKDALQKKIDGRKKQIEKLKASIESKLSSMTPQQREAKSKEFQKKLEDFQKFVRSSEEELYTLQEKETTALFADVEKTAVDYGKANDFAVIVVKKELLYVGNAVDAQDVTDALIKALNAAGAKK